MKKILFAATALAAALFASCDKETETMNPLQPGTADGAQVTITLSGADAETRAFFDTTAKAESWESSLSSLSVFAFDNGGALIIRRDFTPAELSARSATFSLPKSAAGTECSFYAVANYDASSAKTRAALTALVENSAAAYNGTFAEVSTAAKRSGGFVMSGIKSQTIGLHLLQDLPRYFSDLIALEQEKSRQGVFQNDLAVDGIIRQCSAFLADADTPESHLLHTVFQNKLQASSLFSEAERNLCLQTHEKLLTSCVFPAYRSLSDALSSLRGKGTQNAGGLSRQEGGLSYYAYLLRSRVGVDVSPEELTRLLTQQLADQCAEMQIILDQNPSLSLSEQALVLPFSTPEEMLADLQNAVSEDFPVLSGIAYEVKTVDDSLKDFLSPAFYLTPPADVNSPNSIYLNPADEMTGIELYSTLAHEGFPGHLYQTVSFSRSDPLLIRHLYAPSGYVEGWATYVESYACRYAARNLDANTQALCRLWYLNRSVHLTLCSLLDLGIHSQGWLLSDASAFLAQFGITDASAAASLYQYILETPANYLKYCVGSLSFSQLLSEVQEQEGDSFSLIGFHEKLLRLGPLPFPLVEKYL